ncbi:putative bifunctional diguanylate cyclase/phosphodiesterase [Azohydromonas aeria]|uniref:putative bifunctional diguanylate cyclase/phosphodiesterase n=1 Tax=Azohydromonas aeria TaxID=2590212 RepID=UPI0012FBADC6|nr:EAL domain-containing protein [Azohydromonas aeria]
MSPDFLLAPQRYDLPIVALSVLIACFSVYVTLDLVRRGRGADRTAAAFWGLAGGLVLGTGVWAMHFEGMLALRLPMAVGYEPGRTLLSWLVAVSTASWALHLVLRPRLTWGIALGGGPALGAGVCAMHFTGMAALQLEPGVHWNVALVAAAGLLACAVCAAGLVLCFAVQQLQRPWIGAGQGAAALVIGLGLAGVHYTAMAAAGFPLEALCLSANGLDGSSLGALVAVATAVLLVMGMLASALEERIQARARGLAQSLQQANAQLERADAERRRQALQDPLTGVANLALFENRLALAMARAQRHQAAPVPGAWGVAVLCVDVDGFKPVNDGWGHASGDELLRQIAARLAALARDVDTVARVGSDEFVLLLEELSSLDEAVAVARRVLHAVAQPFTLPQRRLTISCSVGIAMAPGHGDAARLFACAETAMRSAKAGGGGGWAVFEAARHPGLFDVAELQHALRAALGTPQLQLHFQPKVDAGSAALAGVEALLRWTHPVRGPISPAEFIPVAERCGLIVPLGDWVLDAACAQIAAWAARGCAVPVAVNFSGHQLRQPDMAERVERTLRRHGVPAALLVCEVTESVAMEHGGTAQRVLAELRALGVKLSIDDFGTGYSSLASLRQLQVQELKIDRGFVRDLATDPDARAVVDAVVRLAHALGLVVVAEGVETAEQRHVLLALGCDQLQGYHFARPMPAPALEAAGLVAAAQPLRELLHAPLHAVPAPPPKPARQGA